MSRRIAAATENAVAEYRSTISAFRKNGVKIDAATRTQAIKDLSVIHGVHRTTLWRALNKPGSKNGKSGRVGRRRGTAAG